MVPLPPLRDGGRALPISSFRQTCLPLILDAPDCICSPGRLLLGVVQSGATAEWRHAQVISIHAPRAGCDAAAKFRVAPIAYFNPRTPYGVRRYQTRDCQAGEKFQSTHPIRGATFGFTMSSNFTLIFQSTHPIRGATVTKSAKMPIWLFQSTHPIRGATIWYRDTSWAK